MKTFARTGAAALAATVVMGTAGFALASAQAGNDTPTSTTTSPVTTETGNEVALQNLKAAHQRDRDDAAEDAAEDAAKAAAEADDPVAPVDTTEPTLPAPAPKAAKRDHGRHHDCDGKNGRHHGRHHNGRHDNGRHQGRFGDNGRHHGGHHDGGRHGGRD